MANFSIDVIDKNSEITERFSALVQEKSEVVISINTGTDSYYPIISQCRVNFEGSSYVENAPYKDVVGLPKELTFEHGKIKTSGKPYVDVTEAFRSDDWIGVMELTNRKRVNILPYSSPKITILTSYRSNLNGTENPEGTRISIKFTSEISELNGLNDKKCTLYYREITTSDWLNAGDIAIDYIVENGEIISDPIFDVEKSYDVKLVIEDFFEAVESFMNVSQAFTIIDFHVSGKGFAIGKVSEIPNAVEFGMKAIFVGGIEYSILEDGTDLNDLMFPNTYILSSDYHYENNPYDGSDCLLEITGRGNIGLFQCLKKLDEVNEQCERMRFIDMDVWPNEWQSISYDTFNRIKDAISDHVYPLGAVFFTSENSPPYDLYGTWIEIDSPIEGVHAWKRTD